MKTIHLRVPDSVDLETSEITVLLAATLYEKGKLSLSQAAEMAGVALHTFAETLRTYNVSILNHPASEIQQDAEIA